MKKLFYLFAICFSFTLISCGGDDDANPEAFLRATIDGNAFEAATITTVSDDTFGELLILSVGENADASFKIGLNLPASLAVGTPFQIDATDLGITFTDADDNSFTTIGEVELDRNESDNIGGTFSFVATDDSNPLNVLNITNGSFFFTY